MPALAPRLRGDAVPCSVANPRYENDRRVTKARLTQAPAAKPCRDDLLDRCNFIAFTPGNEIVWPQDSGFVWTLHLDKTLREKHFIEVRRKSSRLMLEASFEEGQQVGCTLDYSALLRETTMLRRVCYSCGCFRRRAKRRVASQRLRQKPRRLLSQTLSALRIRRWRLCTS